MDIVKYSNTSNGTEEDIMRKMVLIEKIMEGKTMHRRL